MDANNSLPHKMYFISYLRRNKRTNEETTSNVIAKTAHPLIWLTQAQAIKHYKSQWIDYMLFWEEIPETVAHHPDVAKYFNREIN